MLGKIMAHRAGVAVLIVGTLMLAGCGGDTRNKEASADHMKTLIKGILAYHDKNSTWPDKLDDAKVFLPSGTDYNALMTNPATTSNPGYQYAKPKDATPSANTIILFQMGSGGRDLTLDVGYIDGSVKPADKSSG